MNSDGGFNLDEVETVIVVVKHNGQFYWYQSDRDLWVLDWKKWADEFMPPQQNLWVNSGSGTRPRL
jgi:hypothetical protein